MRLGYCDTHGLNVDEEIRRESLEGQIDTRTVLTHFHFCLVPQLKIKQQPYQEDFKVTKLCLLFSFEKKKYYGSLLLMFVLDDFRVLSFSLCSFKSHIVSEVSF